MEPSKLKLPNIFCYSENVNSSKLKTDLVDKKEILQSFGTDQLVMLILPNSHDFVTWVVSLYQLGVPCALASPLWKHSSIERVIEQLEPTIIITSPSKADVYNQNGFQLLETKNHYVVLKRNSVSKHNRIYKKDRTILFSSGSTGYPKAIVHKNASLIQNAQMHIESIKMNKDEIVLGVLPFFYSYGLVGVLLSACLTQCLLVISGPIIHPKQLYKAVKTHHISLLLLTPFLIKKALIVQPDYFPSTLKKITIGGDDISGHFLEKLTKYYSNEVYITFGLAEAGPRVLTGKLDTQLNCVLMPLTGVSVRLDQKEGTKQGILEVKTPTIMEGYLENGSVNLDVDQEGFLSTGDLFEKVNDGWQFISRERDIIVRAGEKINPQKIKDVLLSHPLVLEASISKELDDLEEEVPMAKVILKEDVTVMELSKWCRIYLSSIELPKEISIVDIIESK